MWLTWATEPHRGASPCPADDPLSTKTARSSRTRRGLGGGAGSRLRKARRVLAWIRIRGANQVSREDGRRDGLGLALNAHQSLHVIWLLEGVGFLRKAAYEPDSAGRLPLRRDVNPAVIGVSLAETAETLPRLPTVTT